MQTKRIVLFDLSTTGHHGYYENCILRYLNDKGYDLMFVTLEENAETIDMKKRFPKLNLKHLSDNLKKKERKSCFGRYRNKITALDRCFKFADEWQADIIQILYIDYNIIPIFFLNLFRFRKCAWHLLGILIWPYFIPREDDTPGLSKRIYYGLTACILKYLLSRNILDYLFVHTSHVKLSIVKRFKWNKLSARKIIVVPDPVLMFGECCLKEEARKKLALSKDVIVLLYFGVLSWEKGIDILLESVKDLKESFKLVIAGRPVKFTKSFIDSRKKEISDTIEIIDRIEHIPQEEVPFYFLSADGVILPYRKVFRGTSGVLQQACGAGKPVIATNVGEIGRIVKENNLGIVVQSESKEDLRKGIKDFLKNREDINVNITRNVLSYAKRHHWRRMTAIMESVYQRILESES